MSTAIKLNTRAHMETGVHWPEHSALYRLESAFYIGSVAYQHCIIADHLDGSVVIATDNYGDPRPHWKILAQAKDTRDHEQILSKMGYTDIYDEQ